MKQTRLTRTTKERHLLVTDDVLKPRTKKNQMVHGRRWIKNADTKKDKTKEKEDTTKRNCNLLFKKKKTLKYLEKS